MSSRTINSQQQQLFARPYRVSNINQSVQDIIDLYSPNNPYCGSGLNSLGNGISNSNGINSSLNANNSNSNITIDYPRHYSPIYKTPVYLPQINNAKKGHSQDRTNSKREPKEKDNNSIFGNAGATIMNNCDNSISSQRMRRDKTQLMLVNEKRMDSSSILPQINNITNINIHIYQNNSNSNIGNTNNTTIGMNKLGIRRSNQNGFSNGNNKRQLRGNIHVSPGISPNRNIINSNNSNDNINSNGYGNKNSNDNHLDSSMKFLRDLSNDPNAFVKFLLLLQCHLDIEGLVDSIFPASSIRRKATSVSNDVIYRLTRLLNGYFDILHDIYCYKSQVSNNSSIISDNNRSSNDLNTNLNSNSKNDNKSISSSPADAFYTFQWINQLFHKAIKIQSCAYSSILITITQLGNYEVSNMLKNHFHKIIKDISNPLLNIFEFFTIEEITINYSDLITNNLRPDFLETYNKIYNKDHRISKGIKNTDLLHTISKTMDKCVTSIKYYSTLNLKYSLIKPYGEALNQLLASIERRSLENCSKLIIDTIIYGELDKNRAAMLAVVDRSNNIKDIVPYLPPIAPEYKYTLVLDMDETLVHFFFTHTNGMFFVRPYCFAFLEELNSLYEIVTFTAGTKDYADGILNQLDKNGNIIKYRLYRQHTSVSNCIVIKDLTRIGRDLSKTIIIDNIEQNFKLQPNNGILIRTWSSDINDIQFRDLKNTLRDIVRLNVTDVRPVIQRMNEEIKAKKNLLNPFCNIDISKYL